LEISDFGLGIVEIGDREAEDGKNSTCTVI